MNTVNQYVSYSVGVAVAVVAFGDEEGVMVGERVADVLKIS